MPNVRVAAALVVTAGFLLFSAPGFGEDVSPMPSAKTVIKPEQEASSVNLKQVDEHVSRMGGILQRLLGVEKQARQENNIKRLNCVIPKKDAVKGLLKASERAKGVLLEATFQDDLPVAQTYAGKIRTYRKSAEEIEKTLEECDVKPSSDAGTSVVYLRPDGGPTLNAGTTNPFDVDGASGIGSLPVVPPGSPFR